MIAPRRYGAEVKMITAAQISDAKKATGYRFGSREILHEHDDCIRIAYEWLDAQATTKGLTKRTWALKHIIEKWAGRYISQSDVEVAAQLHPKISGVYPHYNISSRLVRPSDERLREISQAKTQDYKMSEQDEKITYARRE